MRSASTPYEDFGPVPNGSLSLPSAAAPAARRAKRAYNALSATSIGLEFGIAVTIGIAGGMWLDQRLGSTPWLMLVFMVLGLIAGFRNVLRAVHRSDAAARAEANEDAS